MNKVCIKMPQAINKCVRKQNIMFMHEKTQFCPEYFQFMKRLLTCNQIYTHSQQDKLVSRLCFGQVDTEHQILCRGTQNGPQGLTCRETPTQSVTLQGHFFELMEILRCHIMTLTYFLQLNDLVFFVSPALAWVT